MIVTTYTCDRCGVTQNKSDQMWHIGIDLYHFGQHPSPYRQQQALWCRQCVADVGVSFPTERGPAAMPVEATLEDKIREIIRSEMER